MLHFWYLLGNQMVQAFTRSPATVEGERGGKFRLLEGNVFGEFTELVRVTFLFKEKLCTENINVNSYF